MSLASMPHDTKTLMVSYSVVVLCPGFVIKSGDIILETRMLRELMYVEG